MSIKVQIEIILYQIQIPYENTLSGSKIIVFFSKIFKVLECNLARFGVGSQLKFFFYFGKKVYFFSKKWLLFEYNIYLHNIYFFCLQLNNSE